MFLQCALILTSAHLGSPHLSSPLRAASLHFTSFHVIFCTLTLYTRPICSSWQSRGDKVKAALVAGADPNERDAKGRTSLLVASSMGHADILAMLIEGGGDVAQKMEGSGASCAWLAAQQGCADCLRVLGKHDPGQLNERNNKGVSPVYIAAQRGHADAIQVLADHNANVNARCTRHKFTPVGPE